MHAGINRPDMADCKHGKPYVSGYITTRGSSLVQQRDDAGVRWKWETQYDTNCYTNHGAGSLLGRPIRHMSLSSCKRRCARDPSCVTITVGPTNARVGKQTCWMHTSIDDEFFHGCAYGSYVSAYAYVGTKGQATFKIKNMGSSLLQERLLQKLSRQGREEEAEKELEEARQGREEDPDEK